jgi:hypothetical protein
METVTFYVGVVTFTAPDSHQAYCLNEEIIQVKRDLLDAVVTYYRDGGIETRRTINELGDIDRNDECDLDDAIKTIEAAARADDQAFHHSIIEIGVTIENDGSVSVEHDPI